MIIPKKYNDIDQWFVARRGKFTSSVNHKLLAGGSGGAVFGDGAWTYIEERAVEHCTTLWERPELEEAKSLLWGKVYELPAHEEYVRVTKNHSLIHCGTETPLYLEYEPLAKESGGSPDGVNITKSNTIDLFTEIKCPKNPSYHFKRLMWKDQFDIKQWYMTCYCQMQHMLMITNAVEGHFVSYDERQRNQKDKIKIIPVKPDKKFQDNLDLRLRLAIKEKYKMLEERGMI